MRKTSYRRGRTLASMVSGIGIASVILGCYGLAVFFGSGSAGGLLEAVPSGAALGSGILMMAIAEALKAIFDMAEGRGEAANQHTQTT